MGDERATREWAAIEPGSGPVRKQLVVGAVVCAAVLAACGGASTPPPAADGSRVALPEPASGPVPELPVTAAAAAGSPLPELAVRRINGEGGWVQLKNELPADRPVLVWFWAPH